MNYLFFLFFLIIISISCNLYSEEIIVIADSISTPRELFDSDENVFTPTYDESFTILNQSPDTILLENGTSGKNIQIKGSDSGQILVVHNSFKINDSLSPSGSFNFSDINTALYREIKIITAGAVTLYGNGATGAIVELVPHKYSLYPKFQIFGSLGSNRTYQSIIRHSGQNHNIQLVRYSTKGISSAKTNTGEEDGENKNAINLQIKKKLKKNSELELISSIQHGKLELDRGSGADQDDPNYNAENFNYSFQLGFNKKINDGLIDTTIKLGHMGYKRIYLNRPDENNSTFFHQKVMSNTNTIINENIFLINKHNQILTGFSFEHSHGKVEEQNPMNKKNIDILSPYILIKNSSNFYKVSAGFRRFLSTLKDTNSAELNLSLQPFTPHLDLSFSTFRAIKYPSIYQLYSDFGNSNLSSEKSINYEIKLSTKLKFINTSINYFNKRFSHLIDYNYSSNKYFNVNAAKNSGWIIKSEIMPTHYFSLSTGVMFLSSINSQTRQHLLRRPNTKGNIDLLIKYKSLTTSVSMIYVGKRKDVSNISLPSYTLFNLKTMSQLLNNRLKINFKIHNLLNLNYEQIAGYQTNGRTFLISAGYTI